MKKIVVYEDTQKGCVLYNFIADQLSEFGCSDNEVIVLLPTREAYFINLLVEKGVFISTDKYVEGKKEKLPIYVVNFEKAEEIGLNIVSQDLVLRWEMEKCSEQ